MAENKSEIGKIVNQEITEEVKDSYLAYAMSVIVSRALPDVRDGLKPVHRRILYAMHDLGLYPSAKFRKSAAVVGDVIAKYHPHGDVAVYDSMVRMAQDFSMRYMLVRGQGNFGCFSKDTKVKLTDGRDLSFEDLIEEYKQGKKNYTYTVNKTGLIVIAEIQNPRLTRKDAEIIKVILDNGEEIKCTPDHRFMLRNGEYKEAQYLGPGESLMPLYQKLSEKTDRLNREGYILICQNKTGEWLPTHHLADNFNLSQGKYLKSAGRVRHHIDFNKLNNSPENILRMQWGEHWKTHYTHASNLHKNSEYREKIAEGRKNFWANPENQKKYSDRISKKNKENWQNTEYRKKMSEFLSVMNKGYIANHPEKRTEFSRRMTKTLKNLWQNPKYRDFMHAKIIKGNKNHTTNKTGKLKFLNICKKALRQFNILNKENYNLAREKVYSYGCAPLWETGINKYFQGNQELILKEINGNHKVVGIEKIYHKEDVYDLTIDGTHNFCLSAGIFVHNSIDGDAAAAMRYCVTGDTLIVTENGFEKIGEISKEEEIDLRILSKDKQINKAVKWFDSGEHPTLKITTQKGYAIEGSQNHPILIWTRDDIGRPYFEWKTLDKIKVGDVAALDRSVDILCPARDRELESFRPIIKNGHTKVRKLPKFMSEDISAIMGALISEGYISDKKIEFCNSDENWINEFELRFKRVFPDCRLHKFKKEPASFGKETYWRLEVHSLYILEFLRNMGLLPQKSSQKTIPEIILKSPKNIISIFLKNYFEGDGSISSSGRMIELSCCSKSKKLLGQIQIILLRYGISSSQRFDRHRDIHKLYIRGLDNYLKFQGKIGFISERKNRKLEEIIDNLTTHSLNNDFVPFISDFFRDNINSDMDSAGFIDRYNFDRYDRMEKNYKKVAILARPKISHLFNIEIENFFEKLLENRYLFDSVASIEKTGVKKVFSIKVDSECHSFIGNGFINHNTEAKLAPLATELLADIEKDTVDFQDNYDGTRREPKVLPTKIPQLLLNGTDGIAVGMATKIPPHNLSELMDALAFLIDEPKCDNDDLLKFVQGPDFPTGGIVYNQKDIIHAYSSGRGPMVVRAKTDIIEMKSGNFQIVISEIPFQVNKSVLIENMAELVTEKRVEGIKDIRDESDKDGLRIVIDLKSDSYPQKVLNNLFKYTDLQKTYHLNMLALTNEGLQPQILTLKDTLEQFLGHRKIVIVRRTKFDLNKAKERAHILEGLKKALDKIDAVIKTIRAADTKEIAHKNLVAKFKLTPVQVTAILEMKLQTLAGLERKKILEELKEKMALITELEAILKSDKKVEAIVKKEFSDIKAKYGDERRTKIIKSAIGEFKEEDLVPQEEAVMLLTKEGYIKRVSPDAWRTQSRGGKGVVGMATKEEDIVDISLTINTHDWLLFFTNHGKVYQSKGYEIPEGSRTSKGRAIVNFLNLAQNEKVNSILALKEKRGKQEMEKYIVLSTKNGIIKKMAIEDFENVRRSGIIAINLKGNDALSWAKTTSGIDEIMLVTKNGIAIRFSEKDVRPMGRGASGVAGIRLKKGDEVVGMDVINKKENEKLLVVMENGHGKQTDIKEYKKQKRGGSGIKTANITAKTGAIIDARILSGEEQDLIAISERGQVIRTSIKSISVLGRATQGVRIMKLDGQDKVASVTCV